ncbi:MAG: hypothetical protein JSR55_16115 [Proteobacteria bacterium]|nr:hypothetical protein [Pseudomonadota bacterium]
MSEPSSPSQSGANSIGPELQKILEDAQSKKSSFDAAFSNVQNSLVEGANKANALIAETDALKSDVSNTKTALETDRGAIASILESARQTQTEIDTTKTAVATSKGSIETLQQSSIADQAVISQAKGEVDSLRASAQQLSEKLAGEHADVAKQISDLKSQADEVRAASEDIANTKQNSESDASAIKAFLEEVGRTKERFANLNSTSGEQYDALVRKQAELEGKITEINQSHEEVSALRRTLLETSDDRKSVRDEVIELRAQIDAMLGEVRKHKDESVRSIDDFMAATSKEASSQRGEFAVSFKQLYDSLKDEVLRLLPSAGAAGLAWTYFDAKARYAPTPMRQDVSATEKLSRWNKWFGYNPWAWVSTLFFYVLFMGPLILLAKGTWDLIQQIEFGHMPIPDARLIALRFLIAVPLATLSAFGFASLRLNRKLYEQYNHKQRVMELYMSFKKEIETNGDDEQKKKLLTIMLDSVAEKAWRIESPDADEAEDGNMLNLAKLTDLLGKLGVKAGG